MKKLITAFVLLFFVTLLVVACGGEGPGSSGGNDVHLGSSNFTQSSITISKGSSINLIDDTAATHIIANGMWDNNMPKPVTESGAPVVNNTMINSSGQSQSIGPFNTTGTFHYYCSVHPGMNLTVMVQ